jgi:hypothetical protein
MDIRIEPLGNVYLLGLTQKLSVSSYFSVPWSALEWFVFSSEVRKSYLCIPAVRIVTDCQFPIPGKLGPLS